MKKQPRTCSKKTPFCKLQNKFAAQGKKSPAGLAAYIGRKNGKIK